MKTDKAKRKHRSRHQKAFTVHVPKIKGVDNEMFAQYIRDAVMSWCGQACAPGPGEEPDETWLMVQSDKMQTVTVSYRNGSHHTEVGEDNETECRNNRTTEERGTSREM